MDKVRVLLVEDDPMVAHIHERVLSELEGFYLAGTASSGREAVALARKLKPDLMILDVYMPSFDGLTALKKIRELGLPTDVIMVTAASDSASIAEGIRYGAVDYIVKPFRLERLQEALRRYAAMRHNLLGREKVTQRDVDSYIGAGSAEAPNPKGIDDLTMNKVRLFLEEEAVPVTAASLAEGLGISRSTARRYLEHLLGLGEIDVRLEYKCRGRPLRTYIAKGKTS